jgi:type IV pilus assembly protein PilM
VKHRQVRLKGSGVVNRDGHTIGIDLGATAVRASVLAQGTMDGRASVTTQGVSVVPLEPGVVVNGVVQEPGAVTAALKQLWQANKFECRHVILGIANTQVLVRDVTIPDLNPQQRAKALPFQAREVVAFPIEEAILDFCQLGGPDPETSMVNGLLIAVPREPVRAAVAAVERAGLHVARVDLSALGLLRSVASEQPAVEAIVDIGAQLTTVVIHDRGVPKLVRTLLRGGQQLTDEIADRLGVPPLEVELRKCHEGMDANLPGFNRALVDGLRPLMAEIRSSVQYYRTTRDGATVDRMSITGGASHLIGLDELMSEQLGLPVQLGDPLRHLRNRHALKPADGSEAPPTSAVAIGLAMGAAA